MTEPGRKHEVSAGVVVFRDGEVLVIRNRFGEWVLPKGKVEPGESLEAAALREVREETGVQAEILRPAGMTEYSYLSEHTGEPVDKAVRWFLGHVTEDSGRLAPVPAPQEEEGISAACFVPWRDAVVLLKYDADLVRSLAADIAGQDQA